MMSSPLRSVPASSSTPHVASTPTPRPTPPPPPPAASESRLPVTPVDALRKPWDPNPLRSAYGQRAAIWQEIVKSRHSELPGAPIAASEILQGSGFDDTAMQTLPGVVKQRALDLVVEVFGEAFGIFFVSAGAAWQHALWVAARSLAASPIKGVQHLLRDLQILARQPRGTTAKVTWRPTPDSPYAGLFKTGAPCLLNVGVSHLGPVYRWTIFADNQVPICLGARTPWGERTAQRLARINADGSDARGTFPLDVRLRLNDRRLCGDLPQDFRDEASQLQVGSALCSVVVRDPHSHADVVVGHLILEEPLVASKWGDDHL